MKQYTDTEVEALMVAAMQAGITAGAGMPTQVNPRDMQTYELFNSVIKKAHKAAAPALATKAGARHSQADQGHIQEAHDRLVAAGALCGAKAWTPPSAIKSVGGGKVEGLLVRYTDPSRLDLGRDYFDKHSDLGVKDGQELPLLWHHNLDPEKRGPIGKGVVTYTDAGLWFQSWLDQRDEYERYILKMISLGKAGYSSGADPASVVRQPIAGKAQAHRVARWRIIEGSVTPVPMDAGNSVSLKAFMAGAADPRAARLLRELDVLECDVRIDELENEIRAGDLLRELARLERG